MGWFAWTAESIGELSEKKLFYLSQHATKFQRLEVLKMCNAELKRRAVAEHNRAARVRAAPIRKSPPIKPGREISVGHVERVISRPKAPNHEDSIHRSKTPRPVTRAQPRATAKVIKYKEIDPKLLEVTFAESAGTSWITKLKGGGVVKGKQLIYDVIDRNYTAKNKWRVFVQVPDNQRLESGVIIRVDKEGSPDRASVKKHAIWRKSVVFGPTRIGNHRDHYYAKVFEADGAGKSIVVRGGRREAFPWLQLNYFSSKMRLKGTVTTSGAHDLQHQVLLAKPGDHQRMIRTFFALRVWSLL